MTEAQTVESSNASSTSKKIISPTSSTTTIHPEGEYQAKIDSDSKT